MYIEMQDVYYYGYMLLITNTKQERNRIYNEIERKYNDPFAIVLICEKARELNINV